MIRLDGGFLFRQSQLEADVAVQVAVRDVMHHLTDGPPAGAIGRLELLGRETGDSGSQPGGCGIDLIDELRAVIWADGFGELELANRVTEIRSFHNNRDSTGCKLDSGICRGWTRINADAHVMLFSECLAGIT